ncbi:hypothetical protein CsatB_004021 [Cannabis sativa]
MRPNLFALITGLKFISGPTEEKKCSYLGSKQLINCFFNQFDNVKTKVLHVMFLRCETSEDV